MTTLSISDRWKAVDVRRSVQLGSAERKHGVIEGHPAAGTILIVTLWIILVLTAVTLLLARAMRTELVTSANEYSADRAEGVELGAIQYVLASVDSLGGKVPSAANMPCQAVRLGDGAFWIICPNPVDNTTIGYGVVDEASKLNLNTATQAMLTMLPDMTDELAPAIIDWRSPAGKNTPGGAESDYYSQLPDPYSCKNAPFETLEELFLVKGASHDILYGNDNNRNGILDPNEGYTDSANPGGQPGGQPDNNGGVLDLGLAPFVTVYSVEPNTAGTGQPGKARINVNDSSVTTTTALRTLLAKTLSTSRTSGVLTRIRRLRPFRNLFDFKNRVGLTAQEFTPLVDQLTTSSAKTLTGLINVDTASQQVLTCLCLSVAGLTDADVNSLLSQRPDPTVAPGTIAWVSAAIGPAKATAIGSLITTRSYQFSADIVSVSPDGRAFRRCRIVVDARSSPPKVVYRQDLTQLGWPLDPQILTDLRAGKSLDQAAPVPIVQSPSQSPTASGGSH